MSVQQSPSAQHEALVATLTVEGGVMTPTTFPSAADFSQLRASESKQTPLVDGFVTETVVVGGVPCLRLRPQGQSPSRILLYLHGGGYLWMNPAASAGVLAALARECDAQCLAVDYRRAPEHPFPAAVEDALAVYQGVLEQGHEAANIVIAGDSAGGGLAIVLLLAAQQRGLPRPSAAVVYSPWTDLAVTGESADAAPDPIVDGAGLRMMANVYLAGADPLTPLASPLYADESDLAGLPPILVQVGTRESLLDDARRFVSRAREAGAPVQIVEYAGIIHMWIVFDPTLPESLSSFQAAGEFVRAHARNSS